MNQRPEQGRLVQNARYGDRYGDRYGAAEDFVTAEQFTKYAQEHDVKPATLAVAWVKANPAVTAPIIGARNLDQLEDSLVAANFKMTEEMYAEISNLSRTPSPATDRTEVLTGKWK
ncbi:aldo/keto reductase [Neobacillus pocheonensis]|uniref:aldo/keto reductase n=1 Tax=Neobacillus pocheonensis TaxID=363869 RepID=UPI003D2AE6E2